MKELSFKTNARHIGQLGRELVTDFVTALVELIKNSYDADAECAKISIQDTKNGLGRIVVADCGTGMTIEDFESKWMVIGTSNKLSEPYTPKGRKKAGKKGIGRFSVERLAERVKIFSFPENGAAFSVEINWNRYEELDVSAIKQRIEILRQRQDREAGKFISSQIQYVLSLSNIEAKDETLIRETVSGSIFDYQTFYDATNLARVEQLLIPVLEKYESQRLLIEDVKTPLVILDTPENCPAYNELKSVCMKAGSTQITGIVMYLDGLRDEWTQRSIDKLQKELRLLVAPNFLEEDPFLIDFTAPEFQVDELLSVNDIVDANFAKIHAYISNGGQKSYISYTDRTGVTKERTTTYKQPLLCGDVTFELYYFLRDAEHMKLEGYNYRFATKVLDTYCGIKIYRDKFRVKPYGETGNDWLFLDKEKVKDTHGYLVGNNQTIGRINISDYNNPLLIDATNREGIIENAAFEQLRSFIKECIGIISEIRKEAYEKSDRERKKLEEEKKKIEERKAALTKKRSEISTMIDNIVDTAKASSASSGMVTLLESFASTLHTHTKKQEEYQEQYERNAEERVKLSQQSLDYAKSELMTYKNLASLGMLAGEFGHETSDIVNRIRNGFHAINRAIRSEPRFASSLNILNILSNDFRRISSYSEMIIAFLRKKKREKVEPLSVKKVVDEIYGFYKAILDEFNIVLTNNCEENLILNMRQIDLESIIINLVTNAYAQLKVCSERKIAISAWKDESAIRICVEDSGPGVPPEDREKIFKAFVSTKEDGVGLGLNIVYDIVSSYGGTVSCQDSTILGGACFAVDFKLGDEDVVT